MAIDAAAQRAAAAAQGGDAALLCVAFDIKGCGTGAQGEPRQARRGVLFCRERRDPGGAGGTACPSGDASEAEATMRRAAALATAAALLCRGAAASAHAYTWRGDGASSAAAGERSLHSVSEAHEPPPTAALEAYVTFVVSEEYVLGARVLGQSLRESGTTRCVPASRHSLPHRSRALFRAACAAAHAHCVCLCAGRRRR